MPGLGKRLLRCALIGLPIVTVVLGVWGAGLYLREQHSALGFGQFVDVLFASLALLAVEGFDPLEPGQAGGALIRLARLSALLWVALAAASILDAIAGYLTSFRFWLRETKFPWSEPRSVDLVCGLGWHGLSFINDRHAHGAAPRRPMLAIDPAPSDQARADCRRNGVPLREVAADRGGVLETMDLRRIATVFVATGSDAGNMRIVLALARRLRAVQGTQAGPRLICTVHLADAAGYDALLKTLPANHLLDLRIFNSHSVTARELYREHWLDRFSAAPDDIRGAHLVLFGDGAMADELLLQALQLNIYEAPKTLRIDVLCTDAATTAAGWMQRHPCYVRSTVGTSCVEIAADAIWEQDNVLPRIRFHDLPRSARGQVEWCEVHCGEAGWIGTAIVALDETASSATIALNIAATLHAIPGMELWVYVGSQELVADIGQALARSAGDAAGRMHVFSAYPGQSRRVQAMSGEIEEAARRVNRVYGLKPVPPPQCSAFLADCTGMDEDWFGLRESDRNASRQAASHAWVKDRISGRVHAGSAADLIQLLAVAEHRRWCAQQLLDGMRPLLQRSVPRDPAQWDESDRANALAWFGSKSAKNAFRDRRYHIDLMSFADLACLDTLDPQQRWGTEEQANDLHIARHTRYIVAGEIAHEPDAPA